MSKSFFTIGGFAYYVTNLHSNVYKDQHGSIWIFNNNRFTSEFGGLVSKPIKPAKGWVSADDMFLQQREAYHEFFHTRYYKSL